MPRVTTPLLLALLILPLTGLAAPKASPFTPEDVARLQSASEIRMSPKGGLVAWVKTVPRPPTAKGDGPPWRELHIVDGAGRDRTFVHGKSDVHHLRWTAKGDGLAFLSKRAGDKKKALWIIPADGGEAWRALSHKTGIRSFALHPDGEQVLFAGRDEPVDVDKKAKEHGFNQRIVEEQDRPWRIYRHRLNKRPGSAPSRTSGKKPAKKPAPLQLPGSVGAMTISPDGRLLAVALAPSPRVDDVLMQSRLHIVDLTKGKVVGKLAHKGKLGRFWWSPDSAHLAVIGAEDQHDPRAGRPWLVDAKGQLKRDLVPGLQGHVFQAVWRDAKTLICVLSMGEWTTLEAVRITDGKRRKIPWSGGIIRTLTKSADGRLLAAGVTNPKFPSEVFSIDADTGTSRRLTHNNPWLSQRRLARQEAISFKARDGLRLGGVLLWPLNYRKGRRYPLILAVHGGPESHVSDGWTTGYGWPGQVAAGRGFFVLYPNYRGGTGRGVAFSKLSQADQAGAEFNDLVDAAKHLDSQGLVNPAKVGITGGSYGGYAAAWGATALTKHFAAAVMFIGISDQISKFGTTDIPNEMFLVHSRRWPWKHWQYMRDRSPVYHATKARTPLLIMHGDSDTRVHPSQSMELFRYLKTIGKTPVRLVLYKGEGHGNRRAASRYDYNLRMLRWFEHYLQGKGGAKPPYRLQYGFKKAAK